MERFELVFVAEDVGLVGGSFLGGEKDGDASEAGFEGVEGADGLTCGCART